MLSVKRFDLEIAFDFVSGSAHYENSAYISRKTGEIYWVSDLIDMEEQETPTDLDDDELYIEIPHKKALDLGKPLVMRFARQELPERYEDIENVFRKRGAYSRFKGLLEREGKLDAWYRYEEDETRAALKRWCEFEGIQPVEAHDK